VSIAPPQVAVRSGAAETPVSGQATPVFSRDVNKTARLGDRAHQERSARAGRRAFASVGTGRQIASVAPIARERPPIARNRPVPAPWTTMLFT
jgi:hypothetical protein